ncbi:MAG: DNA mismatch repair protein MutS, partial [Candidatus Contubernalis sp.]|nr:DNA mismatch repair protein MutS [Candidatus Contubernalis sp.]
TAVKNYSIAVKEEGEEIVFLRKVIPQKADRSYGIQVARLAGLPPELIRRAADILIELEKEKQQSLSTILCETGGTTFGNPGDCNSPWKDLEQNGTPIIELLLKLKRADPLRTTPMEALNMLHEFHEILKELDLDIKEDL